MKKIVLTSVLLGSFLFGFEISMSKEFVKELTPDKLGIEVRISAVRKNLNDVLNVLSDYSMFVKSFKDLKIRGGEFNTHPKYRYSNNKSKMVGYTGMMFFNIDSKDEEKLKNFITMLTAKDSDNSVELSISSKSWYLSSDDIKKEQDELRFEAINWAEEYSKKLSSKTMKECKVKSIDFDRNDYTPPIVYRETKVASDESIAMPKKNLQKISLYAKFKFECK